MSSDDEDHHQFALDEDEEEMHQRPVGSGAPWFLQSPWLDLAGFIVAAGALTFIGSYFSNRPTKRLVAPGRTRR